MAQVNVTISGKTYRMACDDGQEEHLAGLAERLNRSIEQLRERFGEIGDQRLTVMAAITLADQHAEAERRLREIEAEVAGLEEARAAVVERQAAAEAGIADAIDALAERVEAIAGAHRRRADGEGRRRRDARCAPGNWRGRRRRPISRVGEAAGHDRRTVFPGLIDPNGSCSWAGPWARSYGAHLRCRSPGSISPPAIAASLSPARRHPAA